MEKLLGQLAGNQAILVYVYDITNSSDPLIMYGHQNQDEDMSMIHESKLDFGDPFRRHKMICRYGHSHLSAITNIEYHRWSYQTDALLMNFGQISSESTHIMDCDYHCIFVLRDLFVSGLYLIWGCNSHRESRGRFP